ncbi:hypothetical protein AAVH_21945 [Aphelenchoides avenae]|nr:hypothetical protein AAVH_21945 [Aphelenchus avenae]
MMQRLTFFAIIPVFLIALASSAAAFNEESDNAIEVAPRKYVPAGMDPEFFPTPSFDENASECIREREPCGFYSFSLHGRAPFKWVKSWCRCSAGQECVYDRTDMKMRVYRYVCSAEPSSEADDGGQQQVLLV